jgi:hypothetical protein
MLQFVLNDVGAPAVTQYFRPPTIYLDHWALRKISENDELKDRLTSAIESKTGTLVISILNLVEFIKVTSPTRAEKAEDLLEKILPNLYLIDFQLFDVIAREASVIQGGELIPPHADQEFLKIIATIKPQTPKPFTARGIFSVVIQHKDKLSAGFDRLAEKGVEKLELLRTELNSDTSFQSALRRPPRRPPNNVWTKLILQELLRGLLVDKTTVISTNHAIDFMHAVVPISYCDFVLLDGYWEELAGRAKKRIIDANITISFAKVFSEKKSGVDKFFAELSKWEPN